MSLQPTVVSVLEFLGTLFHDAADHCRMTEAIHSHTGVEVPQESTREVIDLDRVNACTARDAVSRESWLRPGGARDAFCIQYNLTPQQVAFLLGDERRRQTNGVRQPVPANPGLLEKEPEPKPESKPEPKQAQDDDQVMTVDPNTWPARPVEEGSQRDQIPVKKCNEVDDTDHKIVKLILAVSRPNTKRYRELRDHMARRRRLVRLQVAGIVTRYVNEKADSKPDPTSEFSDSYPNVTVDPNTWPAREVKGTGDPDSPSIKHEYSISLLDKHIVILANKADPNGWTKKAVLIAAKRRLTTNQVDACLKEARAKGWL